MSFRIEVSHRSGAAVVAPFGDLDVHSAGPLRDTLSELAADGSLDALVIDLAGSDFIDSSGLGVLVGAHKQTESKGRKLAIVTGKPHLRKIFKITRLDEVISLYDDIDAATR